MKIIDLKKRLKSSGFQSHTKRGKGSHSFWCHPNTNAQITLSGKNSKQAQYYQIKEVMLAITVVSGRVENSLKS